MPRSGHLKPAQSSIVLYVLLPSPSLPALRNVPCLPYSSLRTESFTDNISQQANTARAELAKAENKFDHLRKDTNQKINEIDRKVETKAAEAKSGISSWFGGK